ncbi:hypothetical protein Cgig2_004325 [Carnegiea gigantea]|uniref:Uncharacterized protein n=1 Tax=Carnegiea gigantea TaxID=171969 RepID=A0A9Q1JY17_9CARY|nr:hypothetical protein Cgig2_004325 [Carnegiea gigantea]
MKFLTYRLASVKAENEKPQNCLEPAETEMMKVKDLVFQQFNTRPPSITHDGHETLGSYSTRAELEVELNATTRKNEVLTDCLAAIEVETEKLQNYVESVDSGMMKIKDLFSPNNSTLFHHRLHAIHGAKTQNEPSFLQIFHETHKNGTEFATLEIAQKYVAEKVFKSKSQSQVLGLGGRVRPKDVRDRTILELSLTLN